MAVGIRVGRIVDEIGTQSFLHAFFSTISHYLEPEGWGTRFPELMNELYSGAIDAKMAGKVLADVETIRTDLRAYRPEQVIWDIEDLNARPRWGNKSRQISLICPTISSLALDVICSRS